MGMGGGILHSFHVSDVNTRCIKTTNRRVQSLEALMPSFLVWVELAFRVTGWGGIYTFQPQMSPPLGKTWGKLVKGLWEVPVKEESFVAQGVLRRRVMLAAGQ